MGREAELDHKHRFKLTAAQMYIYVWTCSECGVEFMEGKHYFRREVTRRA